jgi:hypothetical protein
MQGLTIRLDRSQLHKGPKLPTTGSRMRMPGDPSTSSSTTVSTDESADAEADPAKSFDRLKDIMGLGGEEAHQRQGDRTLRPSAGPDKVRGQPRQTAGQENSRATRERARHRMDASRQGEQRADRWNRPQALDKKTVKPTRDTPAQGSKSTQKKRPRSSLLDGFSDSGYGAD